MISRQEQHALWDAADAIHRYYEDLFRPIASEFSLTVGQLRVLHTLLRFGALPVGELALAIGMARTNASSLCKLLTKRGFLLRHRGSAGDDRQVLLELTPEGESAARQAESRLESAAPLFGERDLSALLEELGEIAHTLSPQAEHIRRLGTKRPHLPDAAVRVLRGARTLWEEKTKKELPHGTDR